MALYLQRGLACLHHSNLRNILLPTQHSILGLVACRHKTHGQLRTKRLKNPYIQRQTDFIKLLSIALVKYERIQTTLERAKKLERVGNLLIELTQRRKAPPDITIVLQDGFLLRPDEIETKFRTKKLINRRWKKRIVYPDELSENEYAERCREEATKMLLQDQEALNKLYGELSERYAGKYGGFVKVTRIPNKPKKHFPWLAYVEFQNNGLPPLPVVPFVEKGELYGRPREFLDHELEKFQTMRITEAEPEAEKVLIE